ncbi:MAG: hypothetical protein M3Z25_00610 [Actinomycetota bacterium]|nr:hypothetical protein [Actinomycetota bacterium]
MDGSRSSAGGGHRDEGDRLRSWPDPDVFRVTTGLAELLFPAKTWQLIAQAEHYGADRDTRAELGRLPLGTYRDVCVVIAAIKASASTRPIGRPTPAPPRVETRPEYTDCGDDTVDVAEVYLRDGTRLTEARAARIAEETLNNLHCEIGSEPRRTRRGGPSLPEGPRHAPQVFLADSRADPPTAGRTSPRRWPRAH